MSPVILIEFNELCPSLLDRWMAEGKLPNFKRLYDSADVFVTEADEREAPNLEPWIQWYSLHTGLPFRVHGVFHLTDGPRASFRDIWQRLLDDGKSVGNFSSMNCKGTADARAVFLPDPWCTSESPHPPELSAFYNFVSGQVREYSNADQPSGLGQALRFVRFLAGHGLRAKTVSATLGQLVEERLNKDDKRWRRATLLDKFQFDVFRHYYLTRRPDFATFFVNSTAHLQHSYWRCMDPTSFTVKPSAEERRIYGDAIFFGYQQMDEVLGDFLELAATTGATLAFATALSQQPFLKYEATGGQHFYRPRHVESLLGQLGIEFVAVLPVMTHQYQLHFVDQTRRDRAEERLRNVRLSDGAPVFGFNPTNEAETLFFGCGVNTQLDADAVIQLSDTGSIRSLRFFDLFYQIEQIKSGRHHPDGCFWVGTGVHRAHPGKISILDVCPTLLGMLGTPAEDLPGIDLFHARHEPEEVRVRTAVSAA